MFKNGPTHLCTNWPADRLALFYGWEVHLKTTDPPTDQQNEQMSKQMSKRTGEWWANESTSEQAAQSMQDWNFPLQTKNFSFESPTSLWQTDQWKFNSPNEQSNRQTVTLNDDPTDGPTGQRTNGPTDQRTNGRTHPLIEMPGASTILFKIRVRTNEFNHLFQLFHWLTFFFHD